jgi:hypothetical protein
VTPLPSRHYKSFAAVSTLLSSILEFLSLLLFHRIGLNYIPAGPSALVFNILYQFSRIVPSVYEFRIFGIPLSNKSFTYVLALQVILSEQVDSEIRTLLITSPALFSPACDQPPSRLSSNGINRHSRRADIPLRPRKPQILPHTILSRPLRRAISPSSYRIDTGAASDESRIAG